MSNENCEENIHLKLALAGNPNVGKSVIFNQITGLSQVIGNWPGKTVSKAEGKARFENFVFNLIDLPGIYSLSTYTLEEIITREYIMEENPDFIINVIDVNHLERNLFFTLQLLMLNRPMIVALNQYDLYKKRGYDVDVKQLEELLGVPVVTTIAVHNRGVHEILEKIIEFSKESKNYRPKVFRLGKEVETRLEKFIFKHKSLFPNHEFPQKFVALKLLENDDYILRSINPSEKEKKSMTSSITTMREELEDMHGEQISTIINSEFFNIANDISQKSEIIKKQTRKQSWSIIADHLTIHSFFGYILLFAILFGSYLLIFNFGDWISGLLDELVLLIEPSATLFLGGEGSWWYKIIWKGLFGGFLGAIGGVLPYVIPFFIMIELLQDIGYLPRAAYLMDQFMHKIGIHGKSIIPILLGFGCNVPAIAAASIMETQKEKKRSILVSSMIPCSAVTTIILGLVGSYIGIEYAFLLYLVNFSAIILVGKILTSMDVIVESELIIELHDFRVPNFKVIAKQTWKRSREFVVLALPLIVIMSALLEVFLEFNILGPLNLLLYPITGLFLGLPIGIGAYLIYGILRKELNLVLLQIFVASLGLTMIEYLSPIQMVTFSLVTMLYIPCVATVIAVKKESGAKYAMQISLLQIGLAILIAGTIRWIYVFFDKFFILEPQITIGLSVTVFFLFIGGIIFYLSYRKKQKLGKISLDAMKPNLLKDSNCFGFECGSSKYCSGCNHSD